MEEKDVSREDIIEANVKLSKQILEIIEKANKENNDKINDGEER